MKKALKILEKPVFSGLFSFESIGNMFIFFGENKQHEICMLEE
jgi:hypothetical protein